MMNGFTHALLGWFTMVTAMGYFIWCEFKKSELELEEDDEPPSSRFWLMAV